MCSYTFRLACKVRRHLKHIILLSLVLSTLQDLQQDAILRILSVHAFGICEVFYKPRKMYCSQALASYAMSSIVP